MVKKWSQPKLPEKAFCEKGRTVLSRRRERTQPFLRWPNLLTTRQ